MTTPYDSSGMNYSAAVKAVAKEPKKEKLVVTHPVSKKNISKHNRSRRGVQAARGNNFYTRPKIHSRRADIYTDQDRKKDKDIRASANELRIRYLQNEKGVTAEDVIAANKKIKGLDGVVYTFKLLEMMFKNNRMLENNTPVTAEMVYEQYKKAEEKCRYLINKGHDYSDRLNQLLLNCACLYEYLWLNNIELSITQNLAETIKPYPLEKDEIVRGNSRGTASPPKNEQPLRCKAQSITAEMIINVIPDTPMGRSKLAVISQKLLAAPHGR